MQSHYPPTFGSKIGLTGRHAATGDEAAAASAPIPQEKPVAAAAAGIVHPDTPMTGQIETFNQLWQAVAIAGAVKSEDDGTQPRPQASGPPKKKHKGAGSNRAARRDLDKMAKQELRMMKNRESAARSRLRRQQHTAQLEQENEQLQAQIDSLKAQVQQLQGQLNEAEWQLQLAKVPQAMQRTSISVSRTQQISQLPPAPSLSLSLPAASSLMLPPSMAGMEAHDLVGGGNELGANMGHDGAGAQDGLGMVDNFDFPFTSRRGSSYA